MIRVIADGALPSPAKCASCGSSETTSRVYVDFKYYQKRVGRILICSICMAEASESPYLNFITQERHNKLLKMYDDQASALAVSTDAIEGFQRDFTDLVSRFTTNLAYAVYDKPHHSSDIEISDQVFDSEVEDASPDDLEVKFSGGTIFDTESDEYQVT